VYELLVFVIQAMLLKVFKVVFAEDPIYCEMEFALNGHGD